MESTQLEMILTYVTAFLGSGVGVTIIATSIKAIIGIVAKVKIAKASKLTEKDKVEMVDTFKSSLKDGVEIDMNAQLDKITNKRFTSIENLLNEVAKKEEEIEKTTKLLAEAMSQFKTISSDIKNKLAEDSKPTQNIEKIEVVESGNLVIKEEKIEQIGY